MNSMATTLAVVLISSHLSSNYHVNSFSPQLIRSSGGCIISSGKVTQQSHVQLFGKRSLVPTESDMEDSQLVSVPLVIDTKSKSTTDIISTEERVTTTTSTTTITTLDDVNKRNNNSLLKKLFLGIEPTPDVIAIATIYFVEGALGIARLAQTFLLKDELHLGPAEMSAIMGVLALPWTIKPLYGFLSDGFPILGYRRRSYLVLVGIVGFLSYSFLAWGGTGDVDTNSMALTGIVIMLLLSSASIAFADVVADGIVVQKTRDASINGGDSAIAGGLQSVCWGSASIGGLISAYFSGSLLETMSPRDVFGIASVLPLAVAAISFLIDEKPIAKTTTEVVLNTNGSNGLAPLENEQSSLNGNDITLDEDVDTMSSVQEQISSLWGALSQPSIYKPVLFIFLWHATPSSDGASLYFLTNEIGLGPEFLGRVRVVTAISSLFGVWLYNQYLRTVPIKNVLLWTTLISVPLGLTQLLLISHYNRVLGIPDGLFVFGDDAVLSILGKKLCKWKRCLMVNEY